MREHALCLGEPFDGICASLLLEDGEPRGMSAADGAGLVLAEEGSRGELVLRGVQVGGRERRRGEGAAASDAYRTGDIVRRGDGGRLTFVGRADQQVKLNGRRIELGPIEAAISRLMLPIVQRAVVLLAGRGLHAFCQGGHAPRLLPNLHSRAVRLLCGLELPPHLVPSGVTFLSQLPVTATGKTDDRVLKAMLDTGKSGAAEGAEASGGGGRWAPTGWLRAVADVWACELDIPLGLFSEESDFVALSGNSLVALRISTRLWHLAKRRAAGSGGTFGEFQGAFSPARLLATPLLGEYAAMLLHAGPADGDAHSRSDANGGGDDGWGCDARPRHELALSALDELAVEAVGAGALGLLRVLLARDDYAPTAAHADRLLLAAVRQCRTHGGGCAQEMLRHGASPNAVGPGGESVLSMAVQHVAGCSEPLVAELLAGGADVRSVDDNLQTALHHAARTGGDAHLLEMLLRSWDDATAAGAPPPPTAATGGDGGAAGDDAGACAQLDRWGRTPLHWAVTNGHREAVIALSEAGSDLWLEDFQKESPMALGERRAECREWLDGQEGARCDRLTLSMLRIMAA